MAKPMTMAVSTRACGTGSAGTVPVTPSTMGGAFATVCAPDERIITGQLDFRWLRPLDGDRIVSRGTVIRRGRTLSHARVEFFDAGQRLIGAGSGTYVIQPPLA